MPDISHVFGTDLVLQSNGGVSDLATVSSISQVAQRLYRRLLTNPGAYSYHPDYGGGLGTFVGSPVSAGQIQAVVLQQCRLESDVATDPAPSVAVTSNGVGMTVVMVEFTDATSGVPQTLQIPLN
ncbi:phage tail protein [Endobacter medicaginis]|nr:phage tail protein [Endobacter medicaginis]MCX5476872.1 phage tail protein [Endobacter medicaginis]